MISLAAENLVTLIVKFLAVTPATINFPTCAEVSVKVEEVAPATTGQSVVEMVSLASTAFEQAYHLYSKFTLVVGIHVPESLDRTPPTTVLPVTTGATVLRGGSKMPTVVLENDET